MVVNNVVLARNTKKAPHSKEIASQTVAFSHYNNLSAQLPVDPSTGQLVAGGITEQTQQCFENIKAIVESVDHVMSDLVKITIRVKDIRDLAAVDEVYKTYFGAYLPARTAIAVADLPLGALVQVDAVLTNAPGTIPHAPQADHLLKLTNVTAEAPISPLSSQTVAFSHYNHLSAQLPLDPRTGRLVVGGVAEQTEQVLTNIKAILSSINVSTDDIVKLNIYVTNLADLDVVNAVYTTFFPGSAIARAAAYVPARTTVVATALPMDALVKIQAVVAHGDGTPPQAIEDRHGIVIEARDTKQAPVSALSTQTVSFSHYNNVSAQLPIHPETGEVVAGGIAERARQSLENIQAILHSVDHVLADVVKVTMYLTDLTDLSAVDDVYQDFFPDGVPARSVIGVAAIEADALIQIDVIVANAEGTPPQA